MCNTKRESKRPTENTYFRKVFAKQVKNEQTHRKNTKTQKNRETEEAERYLKLE